MPRFVVLQHDAPQGRHWDFMLEAQESLTTWSLADLPNAPPTVAARAIPDHRLAYLEYEGPISGGRGSVTRWDQGTYELRRYDWDEVVAVVAGEHLIGEVTLKRSPGNPNEWTFSFVPFA
mgnify:CR=1 FL=1